MRKMTMFSRKFIISSFHFSQKRDKTIEPPDFRTGGDLGYHLDRFPYFTRKHADFFFFFFLPAIGRLRIGFHRRGRSQIEPKHKALPEEGRALRDSPPNWTQVARCRKGNKRWKNKQKETKTNTAVLPRISQTFLEPNLESLQANDEDPDSKTNLTNYNTMSDEIVTCISGKT